MVKKILLIGIIGFLIPICLVTYYFEEIKGFISPVLNQEEIVSSQSDITSNKDGLTLENENNLADRDNKIDKAIASVDNEEKPYSSGEPMDDINYEVVQQEIEVLEQEDSKGNNHVKFITKDEQGNVMEERDAPAEGEHIVEFGTDRHLELLAREFVIRHFDPTTKGFSYSGELVEKDERYAKVMVTKFNANNLKKERFGVVLSVQNGQIQPISFQQVNE